MYVDPFLSLQKSHLQRDLLDEKVIQARPKVFGSRFLDTKMIVFDIFNSNRHKELRCKGRQKHDHNEWLKKNKVRVQT